MRLCLSRGSLCALAYAIGSSLGLTQLSALAQSPQLATPQGTYPGRPGAYGAAGPSGQAGNFAGGSAPGQPGAMPGAGAAGVNGGAGNAGALAPGSNGPTDGVNPAAPGESAAEALNAALAARGESAVGGGGSLGFPVIGDQGPVSALQRVGQTPGIPQPFPPPGVPGVPTGRGSAILAPSVRSFKIAENQSPRPQDRFYYGLNFFDNVNQTVNARLNSPVQAMKVYRNIFGFEKTFNDGQGSVGIRLPLYTLTANPSPRSGFSTPTCTALGDLGLYAKYILAEDRATGSLISAGIVLSPPTGPSQFAGANYVNSLHSMQFQPFVGFIWNRDQFFIQGFSAIDVPTDNRDVTLFYNDVSFGYVLYRDTDANTNALITAVAPTFEVHVNTPLNHRGAYNRYDFSGTADDVNLTYGLNVEVMRSSVATFGLVTPVSSPKPFDLEAIFLLNIRFGGNRQQRVFPVVGN